MARQSRAPFDRPVILLTRPLAQSQRFAAQLRAAFGPAEVMLSPLMAPTFLSPSLPNRQFQALIFTSETGVEAARRISAAGTALPETAFCVGDKTAQVARDVGFTALSAKGDAAALVALIIAQGGQGPLLHLRGEDSRGDIGKTLTDGGLETISAVVYRQTPQPLTTAAVALLSQNQPVILPLFSPRSAQLFGHALPAAAKAPLWVAAISDAVLQAAEPLRPARRETATHPDAPALIKAIERLLAAGAGS
jgi:uroporphyrinogen-III synthase